MLDQAFEALKSCDWGPSLKTLQPIEDAVVATYGDDAARKDLEAKLTAALDGDLSRAGKDFVCRRLRVVGTAACVPALATILADPDDSHMARYALESMPVPEAGKALRDGLSKLSAPQKIGAIGSLGVRQDTDSVPALGKLVGDADAGVARAAAFALGDIRTPEAAKALKAGKPSADAKSAVTDASFSCAEQLLEDGKKAEALLIYKGLVSDDQPKHVRLAATRGMLACAGKSG